MRDGRGHPNSQSRSYVVLVCGLSQREIRASFIEGHLDADVCIIGGGFTGISAAVELSERGYSVVVLEGVRVGFGASGRNGGQIVNGYSRDLETIAGRYGREKAVKLGAMSLEGGAIIRERVKKYAIDCDLVDGGFFAAFTPKQVREMEAHKEHWEKHGHGGLEMVSKADVGRYVETDRYAGGMIDRFGGHIHPLNLVQGEAAAAESLGARIFENSRVISVEEGESPVVRTATGSVKVKYVLVCGNAYLGTLLPEIGDRMMPVSSQVMATEQLDPQLIESLCRQIIASKMPTTFSIIIAARPIIVCSMAAASVMVEAIRLT